MYPKTVSYTPECNIMSLNIQEKVVQHTEEHICIAVIRGQVQLFPLLLGFGTIIIYVHSNKTIFFVLLGVGGFRQGL